VSIGIQPWVTLLPKDPEEEMQTADFDQDVRV